MTVPNIEMIAASLQSCSLGRSSARGGGGLTSPPSSPPLIDDHTDESDGVTLELNPDVPLPYPWEQCLDIRTGEVYYINWMNGTRTDEDPRTFTAYHPFSYYSDDGDGDGDGGDTSSDEEDAGSGDEGDAASCSSGLSSTSSSATSGPAAEPEASCSSGLSSSSSSATSGPAAEPAATLVAAGCRGCFMYFMVPKRVVACPRCAGGLLHVGRNGCS